MSSMLSNMHHECPGIRWQDLVGWTPHGFGVMVHADGASSRGNWIDGEPAGQHVHTAAEG